MPGNGLRVAAPVGLGYAAGMRTRPVLPLIALLSLAGFTAATVAPSRSLAEELDLETIARDLVRDLADGKYDEAVKQFDAEYGKQVGRDQVALTWDPLRQQRGHAKWVHARLRHDAPDGLVTFTLKCAWVKGKPSDVRVAVRPDGKINSVQVKDENSVEDEAARDKYDPKARLRPPFRGTFTARNAAREIKNPHFTLRSQRHAVDWVMVEGGRTYKGDGKKNEDYLAWGKEALAPADGTVALVVDGIPENVPGQADPNYAAGNQVAIDLGNGEFALLLQLQPGIPVKPGDKVTAGQVVGRIGNSGGGTEPHLHFQLCDKARLVECASLPAVFRDATLDGKKVPRAVAAEGSRLGE